MGSEMCIRDRRRTDVKAPKNLETAGSIDDTYLSKDSSYAVTAARYAGGYIGKIYSEVKQRPRFLIETHLKAEPEEKVLDEH